MQIKKISINNLTSFVNFSNADEFKKNTLIFGSNGSGKSTLVALLQSLSSSIKDESQLKDFLKHHISKESENEKIEIKIEFTTNTEIIDYNLATNQLTKKGDNNFPIRVFNEEYTNRNIGDVINIDLPDNGLVIGEKNIELEKLIKIKESYEKEYSNRKLNAEDIIEDAKKYFRESTGGGGNIDDIICIDNLLKEKCEYIENEDLITQRRNLGFSKQDHLIHKFDENIFNFSMKVSEIESKCQEIILAPTINDDIAAILKNYTNFFLEGANIFKNENANICPFCRRDWTDSAITIKLYTSYLESTYAVKRNEINSIIKKIEAYRDKINEQAKYIEKAHEIVINESRKYQIDVSTWKELKYDIEQHEKVITKLKEKYGNMEHSISIISDLNALINSNLSTIKMNNMIIAKIENSINSITANRKKLNTQIAQHIMKKEWNKNTANRLSIVQIENKIIEVNKEITAQKDLMPLQNTNQKIVNQLLEYIGLCEYHLNDENKICLKLDKDKIYDISKEGKRISTAQRKILSLCYFFADVLSEVTDLKVLNNFIIVFDDPVDSADYIFFHSIASLIEKSEIILSKILNSGNIKFGQFFVLTHNAMLYDRLNCKWAEYNKILEKCDGKSAITNASSMMNNYLAYMKEISSFLKSNKPDKRRMLFIGNVIRRILEILASFDNLESNKFDRILDGMGKTKLALLANHLSHESFTKVLNPFSSVEEMKKACLELLEVIKERHPYQYQTIIEKYKLDAIKLT